MSKFRIPTEFRHTVSESNLQTLESYDTVVNKAFVTFAHRGVEVAIPRRVFERLLEFYYEVRPLLGK